MHQNTENQEQQQGQQKVTLAAVKHQLTGRNLFMAPAELATYLTVGLQMVESMRPVGVVETQLMQRIIDTNWRLNRAAAPLEGARETLDRHEAHLQRLLRRMTGEYETMKSKRVAMNGDQYNNETCPAFRWYKHVSDLAAGSRTERAQASLSQG